MKGHVGSSPGLDAETVLDEDGDTEENHAFYSHGKEILAHHVPRQRRAEPILAWNNQKGFVRRECFIFNELHFKLTACRNALWDMDYSFPVAQW